MKEKIMKNALKNNNVRFILIGKINGLSEQSKKAGSRFKEAKTPEKRYSLYYRKQVIGANTRDHLLAYAFLRGISYHKIETKCGEDNKPKPDKIFKIIEQHAPNYIPYNPYDKSGGVNYSVKVEDVVMWLNGDE
jgi:hypothetical protein